MKPTMTDSETSLGRHFSRQYLSYRTQACTSALVTKNLSLAHAASHDHCSALWQRAIMHLADSSLHISRAALAARMKRPSSLRACMEKSGRRRTAAKPRSGARGLGGRGAEALCNEEIASLVARGSFRCTAGP